MAPTSKCPLPDAETALAPYIHSREDTLRIRQTVTALLLSKLGDDNKLTKTSLLNFTPEHIPQSLPSIDRIHKRYFVALQANNAARERMKELQTQISSTQQARLDSANTQTTSEDDKEDIQSYITLLRQQQRLRKIEIIQSTLRRLTDSEANPTQTDLNELLETTLGDPPEAPNPAIQAAKHEPDVDALISRLKKEVLSAKHAMDASKALLAERKQENMSLGKPSLQARVYALHCARDELIAWIETELAKVSDPGPSNGDLPGNTPMLTAEELSEEPFNVVLSRLYDDYLASRAQLVETINQITVEDATASSPSKSQPQTSFSTAQPTPSKPCTNLEVLPHIPALLQLSRDERALMQHSAHLRRQLARSADEKKRLIDRLAEESHLVDPHAKDGNAWALAAREAAESNDMFIEGQWKAGTKSVEQAKKNLDEIRGRTGALGDLRGDAEC